jgi:hypothetical protein
MKFRQVALLSALALALPAATLEARQQWGTRSRSQAYGEGYERGQRAGDEDRRRNQEYDFSDEGDYRRADAGYRREYGNEDWYRSDFRRGYQEGYRTGYDRSAYGRTDGPPYGRANGRGNGRGPNGVPGYGTYGRYDLALSNGYNDGYEAGLDDGRDRRRNDPIAESRYRSGDHGYRNEYGPREAYRNRYRESFRGGYEQGYRDGARTNNSNSRPWYRPF